MCHLFFFFFFSSRRRHTRLVSDWSSDVCSSDLDMSKLTRLFIDAANERIEALPRRLAELGVRYPREREEEFVVELREMYARYYGASLSEIDPLQVIREAFQLIYRLNLRLPTRFVMLDKAIATLGSVGAELYPDFNVFEIAKPYARGLMLERFTPQRVISRARKEGWQLAQIAYDIPYQVHDFLEEVRDGQIEVGFVLSGVLGVWLLYAVVRRGRL